MYKLFYGSFYDLYSEVTDLTAKVPETEFHTLKPSHMNLPQYLTDRRSNGQIRLYRTPCLGFIDYS